LQTELHREHVGGLESVQIVEVDWSIAVAAEILVAVQSGAVSFDECDLSVPTRRRFEGQGLTGVRRRDKCLIIRGCTVGTSCCGKILRASNDTDAELLAIINRHACTD
jgi:hypothetical protein